MAKQIKTLLTTFLLLSFTSTIAHLESGCGEYCRPSCRTGFQCVSQTCVTVCNPECDSGFTCNPVTQECEEDTTTTTGSISAFEDENLNLDDEQFLVNEIDPDVDTFEDETINSDSDEINDENFDETSQNDSWDESYEDSSNYNEEID